MFLHPDHVSGVVQLKKIVETFVEKVLQFLSLIYFQSDQSLSSYSSLSILLPQNFF